MGNRFGKLMSVMLTYPQLYPGYLIPEEKQNLETLKIGVSTGLILLFLCILILVFVCILFCRGGWSKESKVNEPALKEH
jgi:hypothetical protein